MKVSALSKHHILTIFILYTGITLSFFYPLISKLNSALIGPPNINMEFLWNLWYGREAILNKEVSLIYTNHIFYPEGHTLLLHTMSWFNVFLGVPLQKILGLLLTYNFLMLHTFVVSGIGAYLLCRYFVKDKFLSFIGGYIYAFNPYHFGHSLYHLNIASMQFIPFFILFYFRALTEGQRRYLFLAVLFFVLASLCSWYYLMILSLFILIEFFLHIVLNRTIDYQRLLKGSLIVLLTFLILSPLAYPMLKTYLGNRAIIDRQGAVTGYAIDLLGFITPQHPLLANLLNLRFNVSGPFANPTETEGFLGYTNIILLLSLLIFRFKENRKMILLFLAFALSSMGMILSVNGHAVPSVRLPYYILSKLPIARVPRDPGTMIVMAYLFLSILSVKGLKYISMKIQKVGYSRNLLSFLIFVLIFSEFYAIARPLTTYELPTIYEGIDKNSKGAILHIPFERTYLLDVLNQHHMMEQTIHHRKIVTGIVAKQITPSLRDRLSLKNISLFKEELVNNNVEYVILHKYVYVTPYFWWSASHEDINVLNKTFEKLKEDRTHILYATGRSGKDKIYIKKKG